MTISRSAMAGILLTNCSTILRIVFGPFHITVVILVYYLYKVYFNFCVYLLTFKNFLASAFIVDFERMAGG